MKRVDILVTYVKGKSDTTWSKFEDVTVHANQGEYFLVKTRADDVEYTYMIRHKVIESIRLMTYSKK